ncbi:MAG: hypothetical protein EOO77_26845 [Oxalobacteraceae bacterium]|nr:MAG: hypothetical protein EOO77_26845 [Oxalobacteraceae bacterium]
MYSVLISAAGWILGQLTGEVFKRAAIFLTMNIVLGYLVNWIQGQVVQGLSISSGGSTLSTLFQSVGGMVLYVFDIMWVIPGLFLVMNVKLWRLSGRLMIKAITG